MIDTTKIHPSLKHYRFKYASTINVNEISSETSKVKHRIMLRKKGSRGKWSFLGDKGGVIEYPTEQEAQDDVRSLNE